MVNEINSDEMHNEISSDGLLEENGNQILLSVLRFVALQAFCSGDTNNEFSHKDRWRGNL